MPSLRERQEDLRALATHYLAHAKLRQHRSELELSRSAEHAIRSYQWPGNLRELRNAVERAVILAPGPTIEPEDLGIPSAADAPPLQLTQAAEVAVGADISLEALEREHIARVITRTSTLDAAARMLGIDTTTLQRKRKRYGLA